MPKKDIKNFRQDMNKYFLRANEMLGKIKNENGTTYTNMKKSVSRLIIMSYNEETTFEALRKEYQTLQEQAAQYIREQRFHVGYSIEGAEDSKENDKIIESAFGNSNKRTAVKVANRILEASTVWINAVDKHYPDIKKREIEQEHQKKAEAKKEEDDKRAKYAAVIHECDKAFDKIFVPDVNSKEPLFKKASSAVQKLMNRVHREHPGVDEYFLVKDDMKAARKALAAYVWDVREKYGTGQSAGYNNPVYENDVAVTLEKMKDEEEKKKFKSAVDMMESIRKNNREIDLSYGNITVSSDRKELAEGSAIVLNNIKKRSKGALMGAAITNSSEFNNLKKCYANAIQKLGDEKLSHEEYREVLKQMKEAAAVYIRAKRVQKGYDTKEVPNDAIDDAMIGRAKKEGAPSIYSDQGKERYSFATIVYRTAITLGYTLDSYEEKVANEEKDKKRAENYVKEREQFMAEKEQLDKELETYAKGEDFEKRVEKVKNLSNAMAEKYNKGMDIWSNERAEYDRAIKELKGIELDQNKELKENDEIEEMSMN